MPTPDINSIITTLSELSGKSTEEKNTMVAGGNVLLEVVKQGTPCASSSTLSGLLGENDVTAAQTGFNISSTGVVTANSDLKYTVIVILTPFQKGDILHYHREASTDRTMRFGFTTVDPSSLTTIEGLTLDIVSNKTAQVHDHDIICPYDNAYLLFDYYNSEWTANTLQYTLWHTGTKKMEKQDELESAISALNANVYGGSYEIDGKSMALFSNTYFIGTDLVLHNHSSYRLWRIKNKGYTHIRAFTRAYEALTTLAFYVNGAYTAQDDCIMTTRTGFKWYEADIPEDCTTIAVSYRGPSGNPDEADVRILLTVACDSLVDDVKELRRIHDIPMDYVPREISAVEKSEVPPYFLSRPEEPTIEHYNSYLEEKIQSIPEGKHFIFVTDTHWRYNTKRSPAIINYVRKRTGIPYIIFGGDAIHRPANVDAETPPGSSIWNMYFSSYVTPAESRLRAQMELSEYCTVMKEKFGDHFLFVTGNHDLGLANLDDSGWNIEDKNTARVPFLDIVKEAHTSLKDRAVYDEDGLNNVSLLNLSNDEAEELKAYIKQCYYVDDEAQKLRYIVTYTGQGSNLDGIVTRLFGYSGQDCLCTQLKFIGTALLTLPKGYDVVIVGHWPYKRTASASQFFNGFHWLCIMLRAYRAKTSYTVNIREGGTNLYRTWLYSSSRVRDFTSLSYTGRLLIVSGHHHSSFATVITQSSSTYQGSLVAYNGENYPYNVDHTERQWQFLGITTHWDGYNPIIVGGENKHWNIPGTTPTGGSITTDCAFDIITIADDHRVYCTRIGYGNDRGFVLPEFDPGLYIGVVSDEQDEGSMDDEE